MELFFIVLIYIFLVKSYGIYFPPIWPDEVLFSSSAHQLATTGIFATNVLSGIVYGMDKATLWNSPLYMIILSFLYRIGGESLWIGRNFSLLMGIASLIIFYYVLILILRHKKISLILTLLLAIDLSFSRSANIMRMEILNLFWIFLCIYFLEKKNTMFSGIFMGLSALTHPISIFLIPIVFLYQKRDKNNILKIAFWTFCIMLPWLIYIILYRDIFEFQFLSQFSRKSTHYNFQSALYLIKVLGGQYQTKVGFILIYLAFTIVLGLSIFYWKKIIHRYVIMFFIVLLVVLLSSEAWYSVYPIPFMLIALGVLSVYTRINKFLYIIAMIFFLIQISFWYISIQRYEQYHHEFKNFISFVNQNTKNCKSIFLQTIPDPYFHLPRKKIYREFPPYGLFRNMEYSFFEVRYQTYQNTDCFIISDQEPIEPALQKFLDHNSFVVIPYPEYRYLPRGNIYVQNR